MKIDTFIKTGNTHNICQDFACKSDTYPCMVISDGCSSSENSSYGSHVISTYINTYLSTSIQKNAYFDMLDECLESMMKDIIDTHSITLGELFFDATYIYAYVYNGFLFTSHRGDGNIYIKFKNGNSKIINYKYTNNAPFYKSYDLNKNRKQQYINSNGKLIITHTYLNNLGEVFTTETYEYDNTYIDNIVMDVTDIYSVTISSDGIESFDSLNYIDVIKKLCAFKNTNGIFQQRKANREFIDNKYNHFDDISLATFILE